MDTSKSYQIIPIYRNRTVKDEPAAVIQPFIEIAHYLDYSNLGLKENFLKIFFDQSELKIPSRKTVFEQKEYAEAPLQFYN